MMPESRTWEMGVLRDLRETYEGRGMHFYINPPPDVVPRFLGGYRPDAIAIGSDGQGVVFEVKSYRTPTTQGQMDELKRRVSTQDGWQLEVIYTNPPTDETNIAKPTAEQIESRLEEVEKLEQAGYHAPAFLTGWAVLESLARLATPPGSSAQAISLGAIQVVQKLAELGYLENEEASGLRALAKIRNAVVHGDFSVNVSAAQVMTFLERLKALTSEIVRSTSTQTSV
jgi:REase_AHJR-like